MGQRHRHSVRTRFLLRVTRPISRLIARGSWEAWGAWGAAWGRLGVGLGSAWGRLGGTSGAILTLLLFRSLQLGVCLFMPRPGGIRSGTAPRATERMTDRSTKRASERAKVVRVPSGKVDEVTIHYTSSLFAFALYLLPSPRRFPLRPKRKVLLVTTRRHGVASHTYNFTARHDCETRCCFVACQTRITTTGEIPTDSVCGPHGLVSTAAAGWE